MVTRRGLLGAALGAAGGLAKPRSLRAAVPPRVLQAAQTRVALMDPQMPTSVWGYNESVPGPLLRVPQGERVRVTLRNQLDIGTTIHWHGIRIDNAMDGVGGLTQQPVSGGGTFDYDFVVPDAGTFWYHPHFRSSEAVGRGLYGLLIVDEAEPPVVDRDLVLVVDDWRLNDDQQIDLASFGNLHDAAHDGRLGNVLTVNGRPAPDVPVRYGERVRWRLLNAANSRVMMIDLGRLRAQLVALDGQPVNPRPVSGARLTLAPGQRADLVTDVDLEPGERTELNVVTRGGSALAATVIVAGQRVRDNPLSTALTLPPNPLAARVELSTAQEVALLMQGGAMGGLASAHLEGVELGMRSLAAKGKVWALNGTVGMTDTPLFSARAGATVRVNIVNDTRWMHAMHFHGHHVQVLTASARETVGDWRDTVLLDVGERMDVAFVADNPGRWMLHCHMLEHQSAGMATWFEVG